MPSLASNHVAGPTQWPSLCPGDHAPDGADAVFPACVQQARPVEGTLPRRQNERPGGKAPHLLQPDGPIDAKVQLPDGKGAASQLRWEGTHDAKETKPPSAGGHPPACREGQMQSWMEERRPKTEWQT